MIVREMGFRGTTRQWRRPPTPEFPVPPFRALLEVPSRWAGVSSTRDAGVKGNGGQPDAGGTDL